jgi:hypothetical protein
MPATGDCRVKPFLTALLVVLACQAAPAAEDSSAVLGKQTAAGNDKDWAFIDNGQIRLGVKRTSGAGIAWLSPSGSPRNLINHWDHGRLIQQSYYGRHDDSKWADKPWRWNPVQGGDYKGSAAKVVELRVEKDTLYAKTAPKHWASGADLPEVVMEEWITLRGKVAHVRFRMTYSGEVKHPVAQQEIPAFFAQPDLDTLLVYEGDRPWTDGALSRSKPGWPNESRRIVENWAAYVDKSDFGVGAYVPIARQITCYRFGDGRADHGSCSYFAPLTEFAITPGLKFEYDLYLTFGAAAEIRKAFYEIHRAGDAGKDAVKK